MTTFDDAYIRPRDIAATLDVHRSTVYKMIKEGELPHVRIGKAVRVPAAAFAAYITAKTSIQGEDEIAEEPELSENRHIELDSRLAGFEDRTGLSPHVFVEQWKSGEIEDTTENAELAIDALALRAVLEAEPALA